MRPCIVSAHGDDVDLLDRHVADVTEPERPGDGIEPEAKRVAEAACEYLATLAGLPDGERALARGLGATG